MNHETLGDWCKFLEKNFSPEIMIPTLPVIIRLDGNNFSKWTKGLPKFDERLNQLMIDLTKELVQETNAVIGYTQSDEITLILYTDNRKSALYNDGKKQKILSKLTGKCVNFFNRVRAIEMPEHNKEANFDCRIYQVPSLNDATLQLLWRENDATRNSIQMLGQMHFSHKSMEFLNVDKIQDRLILEKGINWNDMSSKFKRGRYVRKVTKSTPFTADEIEALPEKHQARQNPNLIITRSVFEEVEIPPMTKIVNRTDVVFFGGRPITHGMFAEVMNEKQ